MAQMFRSDSQLVRGHEIHPAARTSDASIRARFGDARVLDQLQQTIQRLRPIVFGPNPSAAFRPRRGGDAPDREATAMTFEASSAGVSPNSTISATLAGKLCAIRDVATTGRQYDIASSTLFWIPAAIKNGATETWLCARYGLTSGTKPVTSTPAMDCKRSTVSGRLASDDQKPGLRNRLTNQRQNLPREKDDRLLVRKVAHIARETHGRTLTGVWLA